MRSAPSVSIFCALAVSRHLVRRPTFSGSSQPEAAVRMRAWRVVFSSMPRRANEASTAEVHAVPPPGSTNSPSNVNSRPRALGAPAACRRESVGVGSAAATADDLLTGMTRAAYQPGGVFHDQEDFATPASSKVFLKMRAGGADAGLRV